MLAAIALTLTAGCLGGSGDAAVCKQGRRVGLAVATGPRRSTLALVPVTISGHGPYHFALDTGASKSAVDSKLAQKLHLKVVGATGSVHGIAGSEHGNFVAVDSWKIGDIPVHQSRLAAMNLFASAKSAPRGLLGSDVLSRFSSVCIDYQSAALRVGTS